MPEIEFTINTQTGEMEMKIEGIKGAACSDIAKIATELLGQPTRDEKQESSTCKLKPRGRSQIRNERSARMHALTQISVDVWQSRHTS
jgi:hypothetical protein